MKRKQYNEFLKKKGLSMPPFMKFDGRITDEKCPLCKEEVIGIRYYAGVCSHCDSKISKYSKFIKNIRLNKFNWVPTFKRVNLGNILAILMLCLMIFTYMSDQFDYFEYPKLVVDFDPKIDPEYFYIKNIGKESSTMVTYNYELACKNVDLSSRKIDSQLPYLSGKDGSYPIKSQKLDDFTIKVLNHTYGENYGFCNPTIERDNVAYIKIPMGSPESYSKKEYFCTECELNIYINDELMETTTFNVPEMVTFSNITFNSTNYDVTFNSNLLSDWLDISKMSFSSILPVTVISSYIINPNENTMYSVIMPADMDKCIVINAFAEDPSLLDC